MTSLEQSYKEKFEIGFPIFLRFYNLNKEDLLKVLKELFKNDYHLYNFLDNNPYVGRTTQDDEIPSIIISYYDDIIKITYFGISYKPEYDNTFLQQIKFDKFFNIEPIFEILNSK